MFLSIETNDKNLNIFFVKFTKYFVSQNITIRENKKMETKRNCFELQREIKNQTLLSQVLDEQIDANQVSATTLLKKLLISKYIQIHQIFIAEFFEEKADSKILEYACISKQPLEVADSFTSLELPEDFSTVPIKSFMNGLFESFDTFLPGFYNINPSKIPKSKKIDSFLLLTRCVFPALFGYCWAIEPANSYAKYLALWFNNTIKNKKEDFQTTFKIWLSSAIRGFFTSLNLLPFIQEVITPVFMDFIQINNPTEKFNIKLLIGFAQRILENIKKHYNLLPQAVNTLFESFINVINESEVFDKNGAIKEICKIIFYEDLLRPIFMNPILYGVSSLPITSEDMNWFRNIYCVFAEKIGSELEEQNYVSAPLREYKESYDFDPYSVLEEITGNKASYPLPSLQSFCDVVQCAHQPLLFTTKTVLVLYRFICSLQNNTELPSSIKRPINQIVTENLDAQMEQIEEMPFWFQCFSMSYLGVGNIVIKKKKKQSPLYRLFADSRVIFNPNQYDTKEALDEGLKMIGSETDPSLRTQMLWILKKTKNFDEERDKLAEEMDNAAAVLDEKRERAKSLNIFSRILTELIQAAGHPGTRITLASLVINDYFKLCSSKHSESKNINFISLSLITVKEYLGSAFNVLGKYLLATAILLLKPHAKQIMQPMPIDKTEDDETRELRSIVKRPLNVSALLPNIMQLAKDVSTILEYGMMNGIERPVYRCYAEPFVEMPNKLSAEISLFMKSLPSEVKQLLFTEKDLQAIDAFILSFS